MTARNQRALTSLEIATHCIASLDDVVPVYPERLGYAVVERGTISSSLAGAWAAPAVEGCPYVLLQPESGAGVYLRFIETGSNGGYWPPVTQGWTATEVLTEDPDEVLRRLEGSGFRHIGGPYDLYPRPKAPRALNMAGPSGELIYFTRILPAGSRYGLHGAKSFVDRPFIMVMGGDSMEAIHEFYAGTLGLRVDEPEGYVIGQMSRVLGLDPRTVYPVSLARIPGRSFLIELEQFPADVPRRQVTPDGLPEGLAMVSFSTTDLDDERFSLRAAPVAAQEAPYAGRRTGVITGPAGEWLELIET